MKNSMKWVDLNLIQIFSWGAHLVVQVRSRRPPSTDSRSLITSELDGVALSVEDKYRNFWNADACKALVKKSPVISFARQSLLLTSHIPIRSVVK